MSNSDRTSGPPRKRSRGDRLILALGAVVGIVLLAIAVIYVVQRHLSQSMEPIAFTQCFRAFDETVGTLKEGLYNDDDRRCHGQRWTMPRAYFNRKYISYHPLTETVVIRVGRPGMTPGNLVPRDQFVSLYSEVRLDPLTTGKFEDHVRHIKKSNNQTFGLAKTGRVVFGMDVYDYMNWPRDQMRGIFFFPSSDAQLFMECLVRPGGTIDDVSSAKKDGGCMVVANVDDRIRIKYYLKSNELLELTQHNNQLIKLVRGFMTN